MHFVYDRKGISSIKFGDYLRQLRKVKGLGVSDFPEVSAATISRIERGREPQPSTLRSVAKTINCSFIGLMIKAGHITEAEALGWIGEQKLSHNRQTNVTDMVL
ncbi:helix-turn-helix domain-containing protein [Paenibacillus sp. NPDC058177]|uniref:helix-turn-helix domain-containing protein n=1 Tax=Paenibacillus sp. NPDC058177 TaxID=3346369 RepID=UPI0036DCB3B4